MDIGTHKETVKQTKAQTTKSREDINTHIGINSSQYTIRCFPASGKSPLAYLLSLESIVLHFSLCPLFLAQDVVGIAK